MRRLVTGVDASGRSCLVSSEEVSMAPAGTGVLASLLATTSSCPPPPRPRGDDQVPTNDLGVGPGLVGWFVVDYEPDLHFPMHNTDTIDFDTLISGSLIIGLDDGEHSLEPGDVVVVNGVDHYWKAGPEGCRLSVLSLGTPAP